LWRLFFYSGQILFVTQKLAKIDFLYRLRLQFEAPEKMSTKQSANPFVYCKVKADMGLSKEIGDLVSSSHF
jgi:hypothetical protein